MREVIGKVGKRLISQRIGTAWIAAVLALVALGFSLATLPCTDIMLYPPDPQAKDKSCVSVRTMDFEFNLYYFAEAVPIGTKIVSAKPDGNGKEGRSWTTTRGFVGISGLFYLFAGKGCYFEGMNDAGLSASLLWLDKSEKGFPQPVRGDSNVSIQNVVSFVLGQYTKVDDNLIQALKGITVWQQPLEPIPYVKIPLSLYLIIHDENRKTVIVQWVGGKAHLITEDDASKPFYVFANDPVFSQQEENIKTYDDVTKRTWFRIPDGNALPLAKSIPGDSSSPSRFVRAFKLNRAAQDIYRPFGLSPQDPPLWRVQIANRMMARMEQVFGECPDNESPLDDYFHTIFTVTRDHTNRTMYIRGLYNASLRKIDLTKIDFTAKRNWPWMFVDPDSTTAGYPLKFAEDITPVFQSAEPSYSAIGQVFSLRLSIPVRDLKGLPGQFYIYRKTAAGVMDCWDGKAWIPPAYPEGMILVPQAETDSLDTRRFEGLFTEAQIADWEGTRIFAGYGRSQTEMLMSDRCHLVFSVANPYRIFDEAAALSEISVTPMGWATEREE